MKKILVISGKGGTGKTTVAAAFTSLARDAAIADCDVDAPDLHILLQSTDIEEMPFYALKKAVRDRGKCISCGLCLCVCRYGAIDNSCRIDRLKCEGCSACAYVCIPGAITMEESEAGKICSAVTRFGPFVYGVLNAGEEASGRLVVEVKKKAHEIASKENREYLIIDGAPGIGCPVIASLANVDVALIVTEPTVSGLHDLDRILSVASKFGVKSCVCVNKWDICQEKTAEIEGYCANKKIPVVGRIGYDPSVVKAMSELKTLPEYGGNAAKEVAAVWEKVVSLL